MKKSLIISSHTDDCVFSMGSYIQTLEKVVIISPFAGIPEDEEGRNKHITLRHEHSLACSFYPNVEFINGEFLDDVYHDTRNLDVLVNWFSNIIGILEVDSYCDIYIPLGIWHKDHILVRDIFIKHFRVDYYYAELPYFVRWPHIYENLKEVLLSNRTLITSQPNDLKKKACRMYKSQTDEGVLRDILVEERIWK